MNLIKIYLAAFKKHKEIVFILCVGMILRVSLNNILYSGDLMGFILWARYTATHALSEVFVNLPGGYPPYPPLYYYVLKFLGQIITFFHLWSIEWWTIFIIKIPVYVSEIIIVLLFYRLTKRWLASRERIYAAIFYFLHPVNIYVSAILGQVDAVVIVLCFGSIFLLINKRIHMGLFVYLLAMLTKPQAFALMPLILWMAYNYFNRRNIIFTFCALGVISILPFVPIILDKGLLWTAKYFLALPNWYPYTSVYAYNLWAPLGFIVSDSMKFFGIIQLKYVGMLLFGTFALLIIKPLLSKKIRSPQEVMFAAFLLWFDFAFFSTRIHSRYLIYSLAFFAPFIFRFPFLGIGLSLLMIVNLLLPLENQYLFSLISLLNQPATIWFFTLYGFILFVLSYRTYLTVLNKKVEKPQK